MDSNKIELMSKLTTITLELEQLMDVLKLKGEDYLADYVDSAINELDMVTWAVALND